MTRTFVTTTPYPDLDGFSCAIAYSELLRLNVIDAFPLFFGEPYIEARFLMDKFGFSYPPNDVSPSQSDRLILVDASEQSSFAEGLNAAQVVEVIDHRKNNDRAFFPHAQFQIELVGAAATLIAEKWNNASKQPSPMAATLLYGAILSNTLNFRNNVTTDRDRAMAQWLNDQIHLPVSFVREMFLAKSDFSGDKLATSIKDEAGWWAFGDKRISIAQIEMIGALALAKNRTQEILSALHAVAAHHHVDYSFLNMIELDGGYNVLVTDDPATQELLSAILGVSFADSIAVRPGFIMRKEIMPLLKEELGKRMKEEVERNN